MDKNNKKNQGIVKAQGIDNPPCHIHKRLYSIKEASVYLGRSPCAVREMLWKGKIPYVKDGARNLIDIYDMDEWIDRNKARTIY